MEVIGRCTAEMQLYCWFLKTKGVPKNKIKSRDPTSWPFFDPICIFWLEALDVYGLRKFEVSSFSGSGDMRPWGGPKIEK